MFPCPNCKCENCEADRAHTARLDKLFGEMQDPDDWRNPIEFHTNEGDPDLKDRLEAIRHYTATRASIIETTPGNIALVSVGYRNGPAGP